MKSLMPRAQVAEPERGAIVPRRRAGFWISSCFPDRIFDKAALGLASFFLACGINPSHAQAQSEGIKASQNHIAKVALAVGEVTRISGGQLEPLRVGTKLQAGDRIRTGPDAVAILVFSDEGRLSVRPNSELWIKQYDIDPKGVNSRIELELEKGIVRQISGNASRLQPDRYRLNTPVAAIGVRGTDFLAKSSLEGVETLVQEGKIFVQANNVERCAQIDCGALLGTAQAAGSYLKLSSSGEVVQRAYQPADVEQSFAFNLSMQASSRRQALLVATESQRSRFTSSELPPGAQFISDTIFWVAQNTSVNYEPQSGSGASSSGVVEQPSAPSSPVLPAPSPSKPDLPADLASNVAALLDRQLVWGRFFQASLLPSQWLVSYDQASGGRHVTVGELGEYALWRSGSPGKLDASLGGIAKFDLLGAQAVLEQSGLVSAAIVNSAMLEINFDRSTFLAGVNLQHAATGGQSLRVGGIVNNEGIFVGTNDTERIAGALSRDGSEAGYLFSKDTSAGRLRGFTLWDRKK